jgi:enoyl-[acyl-carrier protein] reductase II
MYSFEGNRVVRDTGAEYPILNAPIGVVARGQLAAAVSAGGGMGLFATGGLDVAEAQIEYDVIRSRTNRPFGMSLVVKTLEAQPEREKALLDWALDGRAKFFHTTFGDPSRYVKRIHDAGAVVYHAVDNLENALQAQDAGVDGLIVEAGESGGVRRDDALHVFALLQAVRPRVDIPIVAAGSIVDGHGMAGAFALGAEGVLMGTRFMSSEESPLHRNYKQEIADVDTTIRVNYGRPGWAMRVLRNAYSESVARGEIDPKGNPYAGEGIELFMRGRLDLAMAGAGEAASLVHAIKPSREIIEETIAGFWREIERMASLLRPITQPEHA